MWINYLSRVYIFGQVSKPKTLASSSKNTSFESSTHYEDINVTSKEYAVNGAGSGECCSDGGGGIRRIKYPKVLPDFPVQVTPGSASDCKRLSLPPPLVGIPEGTMKVPPPPPPRVSSTLGRKRDGAKTEAMITVLPFNSYVTHPDTIPEEHKSPVVPCVPNQVCPAVASMLPAKRPVEPRIVIKASSIQQQQHPYQQRQQHNQQHQHQKQPKRMNIPRVVHPENTDRNKQATAVGAEGDTDTVKRKKK